MSKLNTLKEVSLIVGLVSGIISGIDKTRFILKKWYNERNEKTEDEEGVPPS